MVGSIKLFQVFQKFHQMIGLDQSQPQPNQKQRSIISTKMIFLLFNAQFMLTTTAFLVLEAKSMFEYGYAFYILISLINCIVIHLIFIWQLKNTFKFIENCEEFIENRVQSMVTYKELIRKIELFNKSSCYSVCITLALLYIMVLPYTFVRYYIFNMGEDSFYLYAPSWYPFDWKTPFGYLVAWLSQCAGATSFGIVYIQFPNLVIGPCWLFIFVAEDITQDVAAFNRIAKTTSDKNRTEAELTKRFCDMVQIHLDAKHCVMEFNQINEYSLFEFFSWNMFALSSLLVTLQFELWADDSNLFEIVALFVVLIGVIAIIFLLCEPGARVTNQFDEFSAELSRCN